MLLRYRVIARLGGHPAPSPRPASLRKLVNRSPFSANCRRLPADFQFQIQLTQCQISRNHVRDQTRHHAVPGLFLCQILCPSRFRQAPQPSPQVQLPGKVQSRLRITRCQRSSPQALKHKRSDARTTLPVKASRCCNLWGQLRSRTPNCALASITRCVEASRSLLCPAPFSPDPSELHLGTGQPTPHPPATLCPELQSPYRLTILRRAPVQQDGCNLGPPRIPPGAQTTAMRQRLGRIRCQLVSLTKFINRHSLPEQESALSQVLHPRPAAIRPPPHTAPAR